MSDLIRRQDAINAIFVKPAWHGSDGSYYHSDDIRDAIEQLPSAQPKPKTGHWIKKQGERDLIWWKCSECGQVIFSETEKDRKEFHAFCGRCGAKMESEGKG